MAAGNRVTLNSHLIELSDPDVQRQVRISEMREWTVAALNLPGGLPELMYAILGPTHDAWVPRGMFMWTWRDLSWPITGMFFWWVAGRSMEALLFLRDRILLPTIRWWELAASLSAMAYGTIWGIGLCIDRSARTEFHFWILLAVFGSMWLALGSCTWLAYFLQWRWGRRLAANGVDRPTSA